MAGKMVNARPQHSLQPHLNHSSCPFIATRGSLPWRILQGTHWKGQGSGKPSSTKMQIPNPTDSTLWTLDPQPESQSLHVQAVVCLCVRFIHLLHGPEHEGFSKGNNNLPTCLHRTRPHDLLLGRAALFSYGRSWVITRAMNSYNWFYACVASKYP